MGDRATSTVTDQVKITEPTRPVEHHEHMGSFGWGIRSGAKQDMTCWCRPRRRGHGIIAFAVVHVLEIV